MMAARSHVVNLLEGGGQLVQAQRTQLQRVPVEYAPVAGEGRAAGQPHPLAHLVGQRLPGPTQVTSELGDGVRPPW